MIDGGLDQFVRQIRTSALGRHHASRTGVPLDRMFVERRFALRETRTPNTRISRFRGATDSTRVACTADRLVHAWTIGRQSESHGLRTGGRSDLEPAVVASRNGDTSGGDIAFDFGDVFRIGEQVRTMGVVAHGSSEGEQDDRDYDQDAEHEAEEIEELGVLLAHDVDPIGLQKNDARVYLRAESATNDRRRLARGPVADTCCDMFSSPPNDRRAGENI